MGTVHSLEVNTDHLRNVKPLAEEEPSNYSYWTDGEEEEGGGGGGGGGGGREGGGGEVGQGGREEEG